MRVTASFVALTVALAIGVATAASPAGAPAGSSTAKPVTGSSTAKPPAAKPTLPPIPAGEIEKLFPSGAVAADVMQVVTEPRYDALVQKMRAGIMKDPAWWEQYRKKADSRGVVPWDPKLGITKAEYDEMMALAMKMHLARVASTTLTFKRGTSGEITVDGGVAAPELTGLRISRDRQSVGGTYGTLQGRQDVHQNDPTAPSGIWNGVQWNGMTRDEKSGTARLAMLAMGRMTPSNHGLMFLSVREMAGGRPSDKSRIVSYPLPTP